MNRAALTLASNSFASVPVSSGVTRASGRGTRPRTLFAKLWYGQDANSCSLLTLLTISRPGYSSSSSYDRGPRQMFDAVCANCGQATQVPFQPTGARPVYCNDCFRAHR